MENIFRQRKNAREQKSNNNNIIIIIHRNENINNNNSSNTNRPLCFIVNIYSTLSKRFQSTYTRKSVANIQTLHALAISLMASTVFMHSLRASLKQHQRKR